VYVRAIGSQFLSNILQVAFGRPPQRPNDAFQTLLPLFADAVDRKSHKKFFRNVANNIDS